MPRRRGGKSGLVSSGVLFALLVVLALTLYVALKPKAPASPAVPTGSILPPAASVSPPADPLPEWFSVYFTEPGSPGSLAKRGGPDAVLAEAIRAARLSVDAAIYDLNLWSIRNALLAAHQRGLSVRIVVESDNLDQPEIQSLSAAGIEVLGDRRESLMHNKFILIDRIEVWTGSMNFTLNGAYENNNNLIRLRSESLAENYLVEFEEMFVDDRFGPGSPANTPHPDLEIEGNRVETFFSPEDETGARLLELLRDARQSIRFMVYSFTSDPIAEAMIERARAGVSVAGVLDEGQSNQNTGAEYERLLSGGVDVRLDGNPDNMHHKVIIIDEKIVVTGSYNLSANAEKRNDENTLILHDPEIAALYLSEFEHVFQLAKK